MKKQNKIYAILITFALIVLSAIVFLIYITIGDIKNESAEILSDKNKIDSIEQETRKLENFKKNYDYYKTDLEKIDKLFINSKNPVEFIKFLEKTAIDSTIEAKINFTPKERTNEALYDIFHISARGDFSNMSKFFEKLENGPYLIRIQSLDIRKSDADFSSGEKIPSLTVDVNLLIEAIAK